MSCLMSLMAPKKSLFALFWVAVLGVGVLGVGPGGGAAAVSCLGELVCSLAVLLVPLT